MPSVPLVASHCIEPGSFGSYHLAYQPPAWLRYIAEPSKPAAQLVAAGVVVSSAVVAIVEVADCSRL